MCINHGVEEDQCKQKYTLDEIWSALAVHFEAKMEPFNFFFFNNSNGTNTWGSAVSVKVKTEGRLRRAVVLA